ncbi:MAG TPA: GIY-YIG nuclease family protein [Rhizobiaceae bacterium]|nr:GIY-YIG nuclease family protein [Rhizobiaceae bacterium]
MSSANRKAAIAEYKKRQAVPGIYAVRCTATGQVWVGRAPDIEKIQTRLWFGLRTGGNQHPGMQKAWNEHGAESFAFEELELLDAEDIPAVRDSKMKERLDHWRAALNAELVA